MEVHPSLLPVSDDHTVRCWLYHDAAGGLMPRPGMPVPVPAAAPATEVGS